MPETAFTIHAEYLMPGVFFPEESHATLDTYSPEEALAKAPANAYCFTLYRKPVAPVDLGPQFNVFGKPVDESKRYYIGGELFTLAQIEALPKESHDGLASNIKGLGATKAIRCRTGNWQPFMEGDVLLPAPSDGSR